MRQKDHAGPSRCSSAPPAAAGAPSRVSPTSPSSSPTWTPPPNGARTNSTSSANSSPPAHGYHPRSNQLNSYTGEWSRNQRRKSVRRTMHSMGHVAKQRHPLLAKGIDAHEWSIHDDNADIPQLLGR